MTLTPVRRQHGVHHRRQRHRDARQRHQDQPLGGEFSFHIGAMSHSPAFARGWVSFRRSLPDISRFRPRAPSCRVPAVPDFLSLVSSQTTFLSYAAMQSRWPRWVTSDGLGPRAGGRSTPDSGPRRRPGWLPARATSRLSRCKKTIRSLWRFRHEQVHTRELCAAVGVPIGP